MKVILLYLVIIFSLVSCADGNIKSNNTAHISIASILKNPYAWEGKTINIKVSIGGNCWKLKRRGNICVTDGTASLCMAGKLRNKVLIHSQKQSGNDFSSEKFNRRPFWIKGIIKITENRQFVSRTDNVIGGKKICGKVEYKPNRYEERCSVKGGNIVYIDITKVKD